MRIRVLGSSAGGGFPQWNCNCPNCDGLRRGRLRARARTQSSIAISQDGTDWLLVNASPDILQQIRENPVLQPARQIRDSGIAAVLLMDAQIDHVTGLLMLRERRTPLPLLATAEVVSDISDGFPLTRILSHYCGTQTRAHCAARSMASSMVHRMSSLNCRMSRARCWPARVVKWFSVTCRPCSTSRLASGMRLRK